MTISTPISRFIRGSFVSHWDGLSPEERLAFHQTHSKPVADDLKEWLDRQLDQHLVEANSALGRAINYLRNHR
jgi:transposase